ncbi:MAG: 5'-nucleotidase C-terminal domain-containing protein, partial [Deltaproteobacteria bacterium]|nr:5'-nucleotidase C-terminal domain-containing protein [Deltaproteobacteria bacterium]
GAKRPANWPMPNPGACALSIKIGGKDIDPDMQYSLATNNYIAKGGSGYAVLKKNTTQQETGVSQRDALIDFIRGGKPCGYDEEIGGLKECSTDADCGGKLVCGCPERIVWDEAAAACKDEGKCEKGSCVLKACVDDISNIGFFAKECVQMKDGSVKQECNCTAKRKSYSQCTDITCMDENLGAAEDGRIVIIPP